MNGAGDLIIAAHGCRGRYVRCGGASDGVGNGRRELRRVPLHGVDGAQRVRPDVGRRNLGVLRPEWDGGIARGEAHEHRECDQNTSQRRCAKPRCRRGSLQSWTGRTTTSLPETPAHDNRAARYPPPRRRCANALLAFTATRVGRLPGAWPAGGNRARLAFQSVHCNPGRALGPGRAFLREETSPCYPICNVDQTPDYRFYNILC